MGLTTSLYTGLSGLTANAQLISVAGNNIANINSIAFKGSRAEFESQISQTLSQGSGPSAGLGGTNPTQIGLGTRLAGISRNFEDGSVQPTGVRTDMAIEGAGFFLLNMNSSTYYTRAGNFKLDSNYNLVSPSGGIVQGYDVDGYYDIVPGAIGDIKIPLGGLTLAEETRNVYFQGNLNAGGPAAVNQALITSAPLYADSTATTPASGATALTSLFNGAGAPLFNTGDVLTLTGAAKGTATLPDKTFEVGGANTTGSDAFGASVQDFLDFLRDALGIDGSTPAGAGVTLNAAGEIEVRGNTGTVNDLALGSGNLVRNAGSAPTTPFDLAKQTSADGESVRTTFVAYDSLGSAMALDLSLVLEDKSNGGTTWRFYAQSEDDSDLARVVGNGTLQFDVNGRLVGTSGSQITVDRDGTGAETPQQIDLRFDEPAGSVSALTDTTSQIAARAQDGTRMGTLQDFAVEADGRIIGVFSNSQTRTLGQIALATFANPQGLIESGGGLFKVASASGTAVIGAPLSAGAGAVVGGALELSNVDLSQEFINLITATTGFSASSRVLTTSDRLIQELLSTIR